jgi:peptidyl-prolyl cis-trans isomerase D
MLNVMRDNLRSLRWVLWLVAASMVLYLGAFFSCDDQPPGVAAGNWAALVSGSPISADRFRQTARTLDQQYRSTFGEQYESLRPSLRIGSQAINGLIVNELIHRDADRMGLTVGPEELAETIRNTAELQENGVFVGQAIYKDVLQRNYPGGVAAFEQAVQTDLIIRKWSEVMTQSVRVTEGELENLHRRRTEKTAIDYVLVATADQEVDPSIPEGQVRSWYDAHQDEYKRAPGRTIRYMELNRDRLAETVGVTEDEIRASYDANIANYGHGDQRRARHILLRLEPDADEARKAEVRATAESILARLQAGEAFEPLAQTLSEDPISAARGGDLDFFERERMVPEFDAAVFDTNVGELAPLTETQFGFHIIQVTDSRAAGTLQLEQVREEIETRLKARRAQERTTEEADRIAARIGSGESFDGVAAAEGLEIAESFVERGDSLRALGVIRPDAVDQIFALDTGETSAPVNTRGGKIIVTIAGVTAAEVAPFDEVENQVRLDVLDQKMQEAAYDVATQVTIGTWDLRSVAAMLDLEVQESGDLPPGNSPPASGGNSEELEQTLFADSTNVGDQGVARVPSGALIYHITRREPFDPVAFKSAKPALTQEIETDRKSALRESILAKLRDRYEVEINQTLVGQIDGAR